MKRKESQEKSQKNPPTQSTHVKSLELSAPTHAAKLPSRRTEPMHPTPSHSLPLFMWLESKKTELLAPGCPIRALASDASMTIGWGSNQSSAVRFKAMEQMLRACCEPLRAMLRADCAQHQNISGTPSSTSHVAIILRLYCYHVATVLRATSTIRSPPPILLDTKLNIICLQHQNSTLATLKFNVCNTQQHMFATSRLKICNIKN
jgi:hypothetical protein